MFPFGIFICIEDPVRTSDVFGGGSDMTRHDVVMSLAMIGLKIRRIFARCTHTRHMHIHRRYFQLAHFIPIVGVGKRGEY